MTKKVLDLSFNEFSRSDLNEKLHRFSLGVSVMGNCNCNCNCSSSNCNCNCNCG